MSSRRPSPFTKAIAAAAGLAAACLVSANAHAQACCAGAAALGTGRLTLHEQALVGIDVRATDILGSFANDARYRKASATHIEFEEGVFGTVRVFERGQATLRIPFVETYQKSASFRDIGGGLGDIQLAGRYDFLLAGESLRIPGIGVFAGIVAPTGRPVEKAKRLLGTDTTGTGAFQLTGGAGVEQTFGSLFVGVSSTVSYRLPREVRGFDAPGAWQFAETASLGYIFENEAVLLGFGQFTIEPQAPKRMLRLGVSGALPLNDEWRMQGGLFSDLPIDGIGRNQTVGTGFQLAMMRSWS